MSTQTVNRIARRLGSTATYPDWYLVRRLFIQRCAERGRRLLQQPITRILRDPGRVTRLTLSTLPELAQFPDSNTRDTALREFGVSMRDVRDWRYWFVLLAMTCIAAASGFTASWLAAAMTDGLISGTASYGLRLSVMLVMFWLLLSRSQRFGAALRMRLKLLELGVPVCLKCGYALIGHEPSASRCPECGCAIDARAAKLLAADYEAEQVSALKTEHIHERAA